MIRFACPHCRATLEVKDHKAGIRTKCPNCQKPIQVPGPPPPSGRPAREKVYYNQDDVKITTTRAIFGSKTYAVNGMTSVRTITISPNRTGPILLLIVGILFSGCCGLSTLGLMANSDGGKEGAAPPAAIAFSLLFVFFGLIMAGLGVALLLTQKPTYAILVCTSASEHQAYVSRDREEIDEIDDALNQAFMDRG
jgi:hypothetical protein